jgi:hypothetical protein
MIKLLLSMILVVSFVNASQKNRGHCELSQIGKIGVNWSAYKTPAKLLVGGTFDDVTYRSVAKSGVNFREIFVGSTLSINTTSVNSKNSGRDAKLVKFFFKNMNNTNIKAKITDMKSNKRVKGKPKSGTFFVDISMNGITKNVPLNFSYFDGKLHAEGYIDILDFGASKALSSINKACYELHQGKTWSDVKISFDTAIKALCFPSK